MEKEQSPDEIIFLQKEAERGGEDFEEKLDNLKETERSRELAGLAKWKSIKDRYKAELIEKSLEEGEIKEIPPDIKAKIDEEYRNIDEEYTINGIHFLKCQFSEIIEALRKKRRVEYEAFGPYLRDYFKYMFLESVDNIELEKQDEIGLAIMEFFKEELMPEAHPVSLYDEYNLGIAAALPTGKPVSRDHSSPTSGSYLDRGRLANESEILKKEFRRFVASVLKSRGIIEGSEEEGRGKDYTLLSESQKVADAKRLAELLNEKGLIEGDITLESGEIWFQNKVENCDDPRYLRIKLRDKEGHWECAALDASGFLDESNREITHLVILPKEKFEEQQDQVWEILKSIGFQPENYHNIFVDIENPKVTPGSAVNTIKSRIMG